MNIGPMQAYYLLPLHRWHQPIGRAPPRLIAKRWALWNRVPGRHELLPCRTRRGNELGLGAIQGGESYERHRNEPPSRVTGAAASRAIRHAPPELLAQGTPVRPRVDPHHARRRLYELFQAADRRLLGGLGAVDRAGVHRLRLAEHRRQNGAADIDRLAGAALAPPQCG